MDPADYLLVIYCAFFVCAALFSLLINSIFLKFSQTLGIRDHSETVIRWSSVSKPAFGGISFFILFLLSAATYSIFFEAADTFPNKQALGLMASTSLAFVMGLADDAYNTRPILKFSAQIGCGVILILTGTSIQIFAHDWMNYALTIIWVVGIMNSINMLDNMDGITTVTSSAIIGMALMYMFMQSDFNNPDLLLCLGVLASLIGFLFINWHPSKMFMGDTGSQFLGIFLAFIGISYFWNAEGLNGSIAPARQFIMVLLAFALPLIDTTTVVLNRLGRRQSPFVGGRDHTTHHLSYLGLSDSQVAMVYILVSMINAILMFLVLKVIDDWTHWYTLLFAAWFLLLFGIFYYIASINKDKRS